MQQGDRPDVFADDPDLLDRKAHETAQVRDAMRAALEGVTVVQAFEGVAAGSGCRRGPGAASLAARFRAAPLREATTVPPGGG